VHLNGHELTIPRASVKERTQPQRFFELIYVMDHEDNIIQLSHDASAASNAPDALGELGRATTALYDAPPDRLAQARLEYREALRKFKAT
jgi:hypothetical protein